MSACSTDKITSVLQTDQEEPDEKNSGYSAGNEQRRKILRRFHLAEDFQICFGQYAGTNFPVMVPKFIATVDRFFSCCLRNAEFCNVLY